MKELRTALQSNIEKELVQSLVEVLQAIPQTGQLLEGMSDTDMQRMCEESASFMYRIEGRPVFKNMDSWQGDCSRVTDAALMGLQQTEQLRPLLISLAGTEIRGVLTKIITGRMVEHLAPKVFTASDDIDLSRSSLNA